MCSHKTDVVVIRIFNTFINLSFRCGLFQDNKNDPIILHNTTL